MEDRNAHQLITAADRMEQAARDAAHAAVSAGAAPGPVIYDALGGVKLAVSRLADVVSYLSRSLAAAPEAFELREDDGSDPREAIARTVAKLSDARATADLLFKELNEAQSEIGRQSYTPR